jgi:uncharacterized phage protein (TIGR02220 family)
MDFLIFLKDLRLKNKVYYEIWLNIFMQYNDEDIKTINIYTPVSINSRTFYRIIDYGIKSFNEIIKNHTLQKERGKIIITKVVQKKQIIPSIKKSSPKVHPKILEVGLIKSYDTNIYSEIIDYLNITAGKNFKPNLRVAQTKIDERLKEGYLPEDFKKVIDIKCKKWLGTKWADYLTPTTLFGDKFGIYLNENINSNKTKTEKTYDTIIKSTELGWNNSKGESK